MDNSSEVLPDRQAHRVRFQEPNAATSASVIEGVVDELRTSPVRRTFCLIVLFNFVFCCLIYVIFIKESNNSIKAGFDKEVLSYTFIKSLFDVQILALWRFVILEISYALLKMETPWAIAVTTFTSCAIVVVKCFLYDFDTHSAALPYVLLILNFAFPWTETVFLEYRVLPQEKAAKRVLEMPEQTPLLSDHSAIYSNDARSFYSAQASFLSSLPAYDENGDNDILVDAHTLHLQSMALPILKSGWDALNDLNGWKMESGGRKKSDINSIEGDDDLKIYSKEYPGLGRVFKLQVILGASPEIVFRDCTEGIEDCPKWNPTLLHVKRLEVVSETIDIIHNVAADALGGAVKSRDLVLLRVWERKGNQIIIASRSIELEACPPIKNVIRAHSGLGVIILEPAPSVGNTRVRRCSYTWLMHTDLKGWLLPSLVEKAMIGTLQAFVRNLQTHVEAIEVQADEDDASLDPFHSDEENDSGSDETSRLLNQSSH